MTKETERIRAVYDGYHRGAATKWSATNPGNVAMVRERNAQLIAVLKEAGLWPLAGRRFLDVGCGGGDLLAFLESQGARAADLFGVDLLSERVDAAHRNHPQLNISMANGERLAFADGTFDCVSLFVVLSSILDEEMTRNLVRETLRVVRPGGAIVIYDFRLPSPGNPAVRPIRRAEVARLFGGLEVQARALTLLPPLARRLGRATRILYPALAAVRFLRTHNLMLIRAGKAG
jgi:SAM-dependent methyltransferase